MRTEVFVRRTRIAAPADVVFNWHTQPGAFERLAPPWERVEVVERRGGVRDGGRIVLRMKTGPFSQRWVAVHRGYVPGRQFRDVQVSGPFARWKHTHLVTPDGPSACLLEDRIEYALPMGTIGRRVGGGFVRRKLQRLFEYRHRVTAQDVLAHTGGGSAMHILVTGATGLVGSALVPFLTTGGHRVTRLGRSQAGEGAVQWDPEAGVLNGADLEGLDAVVHLAGENIAGGRWTAAQKARIRDSRVKGTGLLCETLARLDRPPKTLVCASAIGYYGDRGDETLTEASAPGSGFLPEVGRAWESATEPAARKGIRVVNLRFGVVLSAKGGALAKMLLPFRMGAGGTLGDGCQYMSWIAMDDAVGAIHHALTTDALRGPANAVSPQPVTNREYTKTLGRVLRRPTVFPMPAFAARLAFGEMADALLLSSQRVAPERLKETGYAFRFPDLEGALRHALGR